jgi:hypothetical protein
MLHEGPFSFVQNANAALLVPPLTAKPCLAAMSSIASFPTSLLELVLLYPRNVTVTLVLPNLSAFTFHSHRNYLNSSVVASPMG